MPLLQVCAFIVWTGATLHCILAIATCLANHRFLDVTILPAHEFLVMPYSRMMTKFIVATKQFPEQFVVKQKTIYFRVHRTTYSLTYLYFLSMSSAKTFESLERKNILIKTQFNIRNQD
jgi:hypothetical protein